jgi:hypothetical protein
VGAEHSKLVPPDGFLRFIFKQLIERAFTATEPIYDRLI